MFGKRKRNEPKPTGENWTDRAAGKIAGAGIKLQTKFANVMNKQFSNIPPHKLKTVLVIFCLLSGGFSIYLAAHAVFGPETKQVPVQVEQMHIPQHYNRSGSEVNEMGSYVDEILYREIQEYKRYMDSLGQPIRPGLLDSINVLEQIYHSQK